MQADPLSELRWKRRVLVIYAPAGAASQFRQQEQLLQANEAGLKERDVTTIILRKPEDDPEIARRLKLAGDQFVVLLLGKDGGEKLRATKVVPPEQLFRLIDSMPMRRAEMRERD